MGYNYIKFIIIASFISMLHHSQSRSRDKINHMITDLIESTKTISVIDFSDSEQDINYDSELEII
jgi:hypothetical protein